MQFMNCLQELNSDQLKEFKKTLTIVAPNEVKDLENEKYMIHLDKINPNGFKELLAKLNELISRNNEEKFNIDNDEC